jgi:hypothetical protein
MAKKYSFWYSEVQTNKGYFVAENEQEANEMLKLVNDGDISLDDLSGFHSKSKEFELIAEPAEWVSN